MHKYINPIYVPRFNDFGDRYYEEDYNVEENPLLERVKKIKRRYQNWYEFSDAVRDYDEYMDNLIYSYGGKKNFKLMMLLGQVHEYIPNYPEFRKTKRNKFLFENRIQKITAISDININDNLIVPISDIKPKVKLKSSKEISIYNLMNSGGVNLYQDNSEVITSDIAALGGWYSTMQSKINNEKNKKKKKQLMASLNRKASITIIPYKGLDDIMLEEEEKEKNKYIYDKDDDDENLTVYNSRTQSFVRQGEIDKVEIEQQLRRIGALYTRKILSRKEMKVSRKEKKKKKKDKKYENKIDEINNKFIRNFTDDQYDEWADFSEEMLTLDGIERRWD